MTTRNLYLNIGDKPAGPYTVEEIRAQLDSGQVNRDTLYTTEGCETWLKLENLFPSSPTRFKRLEAFTDCFVFKWLSRLSIATVLLFVGLIVFAILRDRFFPLYPPLKEWQYVEFDPSHVDKDSIGTHPGYYCKHVKTRNYTADIAHTNTYSSTIDLLNGLGEEGFELVHFSPTRAILKRPQRHDRLPDITWEIITEKQP